MELIWVMQQKSVTPHIITYIAAISVCEKSKHPVREKQQMCPETEMITYSAAISTCEKGKPPEWALELFREMQK